MLGNGALSEINSYSINRGEGNNYNGTGVLILRKHIVSRVSSFSPIAGHSVTRTGLKM